MKIDKDVQIPQNVKSNSLNLDLHFGPYEKLQAP